MSTPQLPPEDADEVFVGVCFAVKFDKTDIGRFREPLRDTKGVFDDLLANREADPARIRAASRTMERIADLAKAKLRRRSDSELMAQV